MSRRTISILGLGCLLACLLPGAARADYLTPGIGLNLDPDELVALSAGAVTGAAGQYQVHDSVVVSVTDTLSVPAGTVFSFLDTGGTVRLEINGALLAAGAPGDSVRFTSPGQGFGDYAGLDYRDTGPGSDFRLAYCVIEYADIAVDVVGAVATVENCLIRNTGSKAVDLTGSNSVIRNCEIRENYRQTIYMTLSSSPLVEDNLITGNNILNTSPYPFINIGLQGVNSPTIRGNHIVGGNHLSGGIAIWNECHGLIEDNLIEGCGYGILCYQLNADPTIRGNNLLDNDIHPDTLNWGFGIACNGQNQPIIAGNRIQGHNYGVALINGARPNLGDVINDLPDDDGENHFLGNGLAGVLYELYNNTSNDIMAQNNWWGTADPVEIEDRIVHSVDNPTLGTVTFEPFMVTSGIGPAGDGLPAPAILGGLAVHPNPFNPAATISFELFTPGQVRVSIFDVAGRLVRTLQAGTVLEPGPQRLVWTGSDDSGRAVGSGVYFCRIEAGGAVMTRSMVLAR